MNLMKFEWRDKEVLNAAKIVLGKVSKEVAENVMKDAKRILKQKAKTTTERGLLSQFDVRESKFKDGGWLVYCQGPGNWREPYHASFVEMGTPNKKGKRHGTTEARPFMRPAKERWKRKANKLYQAGLDKL